MSKETSAVKYVKTTRGGQITIPKPFRERLGITEDSVLALTLHADNSIEIRPVEIREKGYGSLWANELYKLFAPVRESLTDVAPEEIDQAIDEALEAVRRKSTS
ncbi:MAG: transcriptional regulator, AbrB family [Dehalococcoidia bacterium]|nr:transcriptional regulator, AbrB family [Dehalococcoidia bacterium]